MAELIVHLPGIEASPPSRLPGALTRTLARARRLQSTDRDPLARALGCPSLPAPAVLSALDIGAASGASYWLRFDAVRMLPDLTAVWIDRPLPLRLGAAGSAGLRAELQALFAAEGLGDACRFGDRFGLLGLPAAPDCRFTGPEAAAGQRLDHCLPAGPGAARWVRLITAGQMLFHQFRAPDRADQAGAGLWFWGGGGAVDGALGAPGLRVEDPFDSAPARGLAHWLGASLGRAQRWSAEPGSERVLVSLPDEHPEPGRAVQQLVENWFAPAVAALRQGRLSRVTVAGSYGVWRLGRFHALARWRRLRGFVGEARE